MKNVLMLIVLVFGMSLSTFGQDKGAIKERMQNAKAGVKSGIAIIKTAKDEARELREKVKAGQLTKEDAKSRLSEIKGTVRSTKESIRENSAILRESRKELRDLKRSTRP